MLEAIDLVAMAGLCALAMWAAYLVATYWRRAAPGVAAQAAMRRCDHSPGCGARGRNSQDAPGLSRGRENGA